MSGTSSNLIRDNIVKDAATGKTINLSFFFHVITLDPCYLGETI